MAFPLAALRARLLLILCFALGLTACAGEPPSTPEKVAKAFFNSVWLYQERGYAAALDEAYKLLSEADRKELEARSQHIASDVPEEVAIRPGQSWASVVMPIGAPLDNIQLLQENEKTAQVEIKVRDKTATIHLVREKSQWKIRLLEGK